MNREIIFEYVRRKYKTSPEYLWMKSPDSAVLRHLDNKKWFALIINVPVGKFGIKSTQFTDVMNVKCDTMLIGSFIKNDGIYPGYHMNKSHWISVMLDGTVDRDTVFSLLDMSFNLTLHKSKRAK